MGKRRNAIAVSAVLCLVALYACQPRPPSFDERVEKADFLASSGLEHIEKAATLYRGLLQEDIDGVRKDSLRLKLGDLYGAMGRHAEAIDCFREADTQEAHKRLAIAYFKNSQYADALALFEQLGQLPDEEYLYYYGQTSEKVNLYDKAIALYRTITRTSQWYAKAQKRLAAINLSEEVLSAQQVTTLLESAPGQTEYPHAGAIIVRADETFEIFENNTNEYRVHFMVKILNERGKRQFSEVTIGYDSTFEEVELEYARTIKPDGTVVYVGDKNIRDVSLYLNYPLYSNARVRIISMPEVAEGVIVEYRAKKIRKQMVNKKDFIANYSVQEGEPVHEANFSVIMPSARQLHYKVINEQYNTFGASLVPEESHEADTKVLHWHFENIPEIVPEPDMSPVSRINPLIMMSSFSSWDDVYRWWHELYGDKIDIDEAIQTKVSELTTDASSMKEKARALYNFCAQNIRYVAVEYGRAGYEPHHAVDIFKNKYGDCKDQAILLVAMLRSIGIKAYPVLISTYGALDLVKDFASIAFNHCIAVVEIDGEWIFMDPTGETVSFGDLPAGDQNRDIFAVLDDGYRILRIPLLPATHNRSKKQTTMTIHEDETITVKRKVITEGVFAQGQRQWLRSTKPALIEEVLRASANAIAPGARLKDYTIENQDDLNKTVLLEYEFEAPEFLTKADNERLLPQLGSFDISAAIKEERTYPIEYPILSEGITTLEIELPEQLLIHYVPEDIVIDCEWFTFENRYVTNEGRITFYAQFTTKKLIITQEEYKSYKALLESISRKVNQRIILHERQ